MVVVVNDVLMIFFASTIRARPTGSRKRELMPMKFWNRNISVHGNF